MSKSTEDKINRGRRITHGAPACPPPFRLAPHRRFRSGDGLSTSPCRSPQEAFCAFMTNFLSDPRISWGFAREPACACPVPAGVINRSGRQTVENPRIWPWRQIARARLAAASLPVCHGTAWRAGTGTAWRPAGPGHGPRSGGNRHKTGENRPAARPAPGTVDFGLDPLPGLGV